MATPIPTPVAIAMINGETKDISPTGGSVVDSEASDAADVSMAGAALTFEILPLASGVPGTALVTKTVGAGVTITTGVPTIRLGPTDFTSWDFSLSYWYKFRRTDSGLQAVLAHGPFILVRK